MNAKQPRIAPKRRKKDSNTGKTVEDYVAAVPEGSRATFEQLRASIREMMPADAVETISYGIPAFRTDRVLVWFGAFSDHCSLFPGASVISMFRPELKKLTVSKGTVQFLNDAPLPTVLVKRMVQARIAEKENRRSR